MNYTSFRRIVGLTAKQRLTSSHFDSILNKLINEDPTITTHDIELLVSEILFLREKVIEPISSAIFSMPCSFEEFVNDRTAVHGVSNFSGDPRERY